MSRAASPSRPSKESSPENQSGKRDSAAVAAHAHSGTSSRPAEGILTGPTTRQVPEVETAAWLAERGWNRISFAYDSRQETNGDFRESEIIADPSGRLWMVSEWNGRSGSVHRAERRRITREAACARMARASIPDELQGDFRECRPPKLRLETAIQEVRAFLLLLADADGGQSFSGEKGSDLQAGIVSLSHSLGNELAAAFYASEDAE